MRETQVKAEKSDILRLILQVLNVPAEIRDALICMPM